MGILSGVGVGAVLLFMQTHYQFLKEFFEACSWSHLADWENELSEFYEASKNDGRYFKSKIRKWR